MSDQISEFIADVEKSPGISVLGFMELNKDSATTVSHDLVCFCQIYILLLYYYVKLSIILIIVKVLILYHQIM